MEIFVELAYKSLNKYQEELCGDKVELLYTEDSSILILADGMGSGIRANILATLTAKILGTLFSKGIRLEEAVETIANTLPVSKINDASYSTFSILQIFQNGSGYLVEYDNPSCIFLRDRKVEELPWQERLIAGKQIRESRFVVQPKDIFILMSDGAIYCGVGDIMNYAWDRDAMIQYAEKCAGTAGSASRMANLLMDACNDLYGKIPSDDTTIAVARIREQQIISILTGPPEDPKQDSQCVADLMSASGKKIVSGGITSQLVARELRQPLEMSNEILDPEIPPTSQIRGIDLVTEGVITLHKVAELLEQYCSDTVDADFFLELDKENGASRMTRLFIEDCTTVRILVGRARNQAYQDKQIPFAVTARQSLIQRLQDVLQRMGKKVTVQFY